MPVSSERIDNRRPGEQDLADLIDLMYWDAIPADVLEAMDNVGEADELHGLEQQVRQLLEAKGINEYYDECGNIRKQET